MVSIIIPAHNEASVISFCVKPFEKFSKKDDVEVIVVCNGCSDETAKIVSHLEGDIICIETEKASKTHALNLGDAKANFFPRIYLDADVVLSVEAITKMVDTLNKTNYLATSVGVKMNMANSSWFVRAFYDIWLILPYCKAGMIGTGVYGLSEKGRSKFDQFPNIIADDSYVRSLFTESERTITDGFYSIVTAPKDLMSLIKIKTRSRLGRYQLINQFPELVANEYKDYNGGLKSFLFKVQLWPKLCVYLMVNIISRIRANYQNWTKQVKWEKDESSRNGK